MGIVYYDGDAARTRAALLEGCGAISGVDPNDSALEYLESVAARAFHFRLRASPRNATIRDNRLGVLSRPLGEFEPWSEQEARFYLDREIWRAAVRRRNIVQDARESLYGNS